MKKTHLILFLLTLSFSFLQLSLAAPDCRQGVRCKSHGECAFVEGKSCRPDRESDCRESDQCKVNGACSFKYGGCVALQDEDCKKSKWCEEFGKCHARTMNCIPVSDDDCKSSVSCKKNRNCVVYERKGSANIPTKYSCVRSKKIAEAQETEKACLSAGGQWKGDRRGRGRITGCMLKTNDKGKSCKDSSECESVCVNYSCYAWSDYLGCGVVENGQVVCID